MIKKIWLIIKYRHYTDTDLYELNEMLLKFGRRVTHDLEHALSSWNSDRYRAGYEPLRENPLGQRLYSKAALWRKIFYFDHGQKDYRSKIHNRADKLEDEIGRLKRLCIANGIDPTDPDEMPF